MTIMTEIEKEFNTDGIDTIVKSISIPPRPSLLTDLETELKSDEPDLRRVAQIIRLDVGLSAAVLKVINSPFYGLTRKIETVDHAISLLGLYNLSNLILGLLVRKTFENQNMSLVRFWDVSAKKSYALKELSRGLKLPFASEAQAFGLFCDIGIPLLMQKFPQYVETLRTANSDSQRKFTDIEDQAVHSDHCRIGSIMAKSWGLSNDVCLAIRLHHDYSCFMDKSVPTKINQMIALGLIADYSIRHYSRLNSSCEWEKGGDYALGCLTLSDNDLKDWADKFNEDFSSGIV